MYGERLIQCRLDGDSLCVDHDGALHARLLAQPLQRLLKLVTLHKHISISFIASINATLFLSFPPPGILSNKICWWCGGFGGGGDPMENEVAT